MSESKNHINNDGNDECPQKPEARMHPPMQGASQAAGIAGRVSVLTGMRFLIFTLCFLLVTVGVHS